MREREGGGLRDERVETGGTCKVEGYIFCPLGRGRAPPAALCVRFAILIELKRFNYWERCCLI